MAINFKEGRWNHEINVTDFVKTNITPYEAMPHSWLALQNAPRLYGTNVWKHWQKNAPTTVFARSTRQPFQPLPRSHPDTLTRKMKSL